MHKTTIKGTGAYVPNNKVPNTAMEKLVETSDDWIKSRTGIETRHITTDENTSDLAYEAAVRALESAKIAADEIDMIIVATVSGDYVFPGVSQLLQKRLGCRAVPAFDVNAACTGFIYAMDLADAMIRAGKHANILIVGAEALTKLTDFTDRNTCVLFGDGAGAFVLSRAEDGGIKSVITHSEGDTEGRLKLEGYPIKRNYLTPNRALPFIEMDGTEIFKFATSVFPSVIHELLEASVMPLADLDLIVAHQANKRIIDKAAKTLGYPVEKMFMNISEFGNTSAASIPLAVDEAIRTQALKRGDTFAIAAFGGGLTWGGAIIEY